MNHAKDNPSLYMSQVKAQSLNTIREYMKGYMDSNGMYPDYLAHKKLTNTYDKNYQDSLLQNKVPGLQQLYRNMDNSMQLLQNKELEIQKELKQLNSNSLEYSRKKQQLKHFEDLRQQGYHQKDIYDSQMSLHVPPQQPYDDSLSVQLQQHMQRNNLSHSQSQPQILNSYNPHHQELYPKQNNSNITANNVLTTSMVDPQFLNNYRPEHGFVLRLDFLNNLQYNYKSVQIFLEFFLEGEKEVKCSWQQLYITETETMSSKRCLPQFSNIYKLVPLPNMKLFIEVWGYQQKAPEITDKPIGKAWTRMHVFDQNNQLAVGRFKLPLYTQNSNQDFNKYVFAERYLDNSYINIRVSIPNDPELDQNIRKFQAQQYIVPEQHQFLVQERQNIYGENDEEEENRYDNKAFQVSYAYNKDGGNQIDYQDIFPPPDKENLQAIHRPRMGKPVLDKNIAKELEYQKKYEEVQQQVLNEEFQRQKQRYGSKTFNTQYFDERGQDPQIYEQMRQPKTYLKDQTQNFPAEEYEPSLTNYSDKQEDWSSQQSENRSQISDDIQSQKSSKSNKSRRSQNSQNSQQSKKSDKSEKSVKSQKSQKSFESKNSEEIRELQQKAIQDFKEKQRKLEQEQPPDDSDEEQLNIIPDPQKTLYIELNYIQDMHEETDLKYRIKVVGARQGEDAHIKEGDPVKDRSQKRCDVKGGLEVHKKDKRKKYFEVSLNFNLNKDDILKQKLKILIELYNYDKKEKKPVYTKWGEVEHELVKDQERGVIFEGKFERSIYQINKFKLVKSAMELGYTVFRNVYQEDKKYIPGTFLQVSFDSIQHFKPEKTELARSISCDLCVLMDREIIEDDDGKPMLYQKQDRGVALAPIRKNNITKVAFGQDYLYELNFDLDELRTMNRGNLYLFYIIFILKLQQGGGEQTNYGWYAHPLFRDMIKFNTGDFSVHLWKPPPILNAPYDVKDYKQMQPMIQFRIDYVKEVVNQRQERIGTKIRIDPQQRLEDKLRLQKQQEQERLAELGLQNRYVKIDIKSIDKVDKLIKDFNLQILIMNEVFIMEDDNQEELVLEMQDLKPNQRGKAEVNDDFTIKIEYRKLQKMNKQKNVYVIANILKDEQVMFWTIIKLFQSGNEISKDRQIMNFYYLPVQKISEFNPSKARKANTVIKFQLNLIDTFDDLE